MDERVRALVHRVKKCDPMLAAYVLRDTPGISDDLRSLAHNMQAEGCTTDEVDWLLEQIDGEQK